jgi:hypothetical protein
MGPCSYSLSIINVPIVFSNESIPPLMTICYNLKPHISLTHCILPSVNCELLASRWYSDTTNQSTRLFQCSFLGCVNLEILLPFMFDLGSLGPWFINQKHCTTLQEILWLKLTYIFWIAFTFVSVGLKKFKKLNPTNLPRGPSSCLFMIFYYHYSWITYYVFFTAVSFSLRINKGTDVNLQISRLVLAYRCYTRQPPRFLLISYNTN